MSVDLILKNTNNNIQLEQLKEAISKIEAKYDFIKFLPQNKEGSYDCHFWKANKGYLDLKNNEYIFLSTNSAFYDYLVFVAAEINNVLPVDIFDPQMAKNLTPDELKIGVETLKKQHEDTIEKTKAQLKTVYNSNKKSFKFDQFYNTVSQLLHKYFPNYEIKIPELSDKSVNFVSYIKKDNETVVSCNSYVGIHGARDDERAIYIAVHHTEDKPAVKSLVDELSKTLGLEFTETEEY